MTDTFHTGLIDGEAVKNPEQLAAFLVLRPGDRVLFRFSKDIEIEQIDGFREYVEARWPDVPCLFVAGDVDVTVVGPL